MAKTFNIGRLIVTKEVDAMMRRDRKFQDHVKYSINRYSTCDWGTSSEDDKKANDEAFENGGRIFASYGYDKSKHNKKIWIITEADRRITTILFPEDY